MWIASLIHLVALSGSLSIADASDQFITWFSCRAWSVRADLLYSAEVLERWLLVKACLVLNSSSVLRSCNLTPSFLPVSPQGGTMSHEPWRRQLSHMYDRFLGTGLTYCAKNQKKKWLFSFCWRRLPVEVEMLRYKQFFGRNWWIYYCKVLST